jgi:hypothetical protein
MRTSLTTTAMSLPLKPSVRCPRSKKSPSTRVCGVSPRCTCAASGWGVWVTGGVQVCELQELGLHVERYQNAYGVWTCLLPTYM